MLEVLNDRKLGNTDDRQRISNTIITFINDEMDRGNKKVIDNKEILSFKIRPFLLSLSDEEIFGMRKIKIHCFFENYIIFL